MKIYELLLPLIAKGVVREDEGLLTFWHDSVRGDRFTVIKNEKGFVEIVSLKELFDRYKDTLVKTSDGREFVFPKNIYALSFGSRIPIPPQYLTDAEQSVVLATNGGTPISQLIGLVADPWATMKRARLKMENQYVNTGVWRRIEAIERHRVSKRIYRVFSSKGETVVTEDHSLIAEQGKDIFEVKPTEAPYEPAKIEIVPEVKILETVDLLDWLRSESSKYLKAECERCGHVQTVNPNTKNIRCSMCRSRRIKIIGKAETLMQVGRWLRYPNSKCRIDRFLSGEALRDFLSVLAVYIAEGCGQEPNLISICNKDFRWLDDVRQKANALFGENIEGITKRDDGTFELRIHSKLAYTVISQLCGEGYDNKQLPGFVFHLPEDLQKFFLNELIKGDGYRLKPTNAEWNRRSQSFKRKYFRYTTKSLKLISQLSFLLAQLGIRYSIWYDNRKNAYTIATITKYRRPVKQVILQDVTKDEEYVYDLTVEGSHIFVDACGLLMLHNTMLLIFPPGARATLTYRPREGYVYLVFGMTMGRVRDYETGDTLTTDDYGFWHRHCVPPWESVYIVGQGPIPAEDVYKQIVAGKKLKVASLCGSKIIPSSITAVNKHRTDVLTRVETELGRELTVTPNHPLLRLDEDLSLKWTYAGDLRVGDYVAIPKKLPTEDSEEIRNIGEIRIKRPSIVKANPRIPRKVTPELMRFLGLLYADGHVYESKMCNLANRNDDIIQEFTSLSNSVFGLTPLRYEESAVLVSEKVNQFLRNCLGFPVDKTKYPHIVYNVPPEMVYEFIQGMILGDGWNGKPSKDYNEEVTRISIGEKKELSQQFLYLLSICGIKGRITKNTQNWEKRKADLIYEVAYQKNPTSLSDIIPYVGRNIRKIDGFPERWRMFPHHTRAVSRAKLKELLKRAVEKGIHEKKLRPLRKVAELPVYWVKVKKVENIEYSGLVYDFEVEHKNFVCGATPFITHNSQMRWHWDPGVESVPAYSPIIVRYGRRGPIDVLPVEELFEKLPGKVFFDGKHEVKLVEGEIYAFNYGKVGNGTRRWTRIRKIFRHMYSGELVRVVANGGLVDTSPNHSLIGRNGQLIDAREVKPGDHIAIPGLYSICMDGNSNSEFIGTEELAKFYGFFVAEGCAWSGGSHCYISNKDRDVIEWAKQVYEENFHRPAKIRENGDGLFEIQMNARNVWKFFRENFYTKFGKKKVPQFILNSPKNVKEAFLEGFFMGDGLKNPRSELQQAFSTDSQTLAQGITLLWYSTKNTSFTIYNRKDYETSFDIKFHEDRVDERIKAVCQRCGYEQWIFPDSKEIRCRRCRSRKMTVTEETRLIAFPANKKPRGLVREVKRISYKGWMYDIETEDPHTFTTGIGPVKVHNSIYFSIWLFECGEEHWPKVRRYLKGLFNLFYWLGSVEPMEVGKLLLKAERG